jgi:hypothetical protein
VLKALRGRIQMEKAILTQMMRFRIMRMGLEVFWLGREVSVRKKRNRVKGIMN